MLIHLQPKIWTTGTVPTTRHDHKQSSEDSSVKQFAVMTVPGVSSFRGMDQEEGVCTFILRGPQ